MVEQFSFINVNEVVDKFPAESDTIIVDSYLTDEPSCSCRVFRLYKSIPAHYHEGCNEILYLIRGKAKFRIGDKDAEYLDPGMMVTFYRNVIHLIESIGNEQTVFLSCDTPRRALDDVHFINPEEVKSVKFVSHI